ncbi:MAG: carbohydrate ABC transporter permease [Clostridia bacterium]|nr:carbohydrate ABC transporter permease [Clostridia bacterium]
MKKKQRKSICAILGRPVLHIFMIALSLTFIIPLVMMISISLSDESAVRELGYSILPRGFSTDAYKMIFTNPKQILDAYKVTVAYSLLSTVLSLIVQGLIAYPISRNNYKFKTVLRVFLLIPMFFSGGMVANYIVKTQYYHLGNTFWIYIFPFLVNSMFVFMFVSFYRDLPDGIIEAAQLDGADEWATFGYVVVPLTVPIISTLGFMTLMSRWQDWNTALLYIRDTELFSLQYLLQKILNEADYITKMQEGTGSSLLSSSSIPTETMRYAMAVIAAGPMMIIFPVFQKYLSKGITIGAVKG